MKIAISGASGLVGTAVGDALRHNGHTVLRLVRSAGAAGADAIPWNPAVGTVDAERLEGLDAVVHLAGESIMGLWTAKKRARIRDSRVIGTRTLSEALARLRRPPETLLCASAIGIYGDRADEPLTEDSTTGEGFLADVCREWEAASSAARDRGIRVAHARLGVVLSPKGGALRQMLPPFNLGLGGRIGGGAQYMSWITLQDVFRAVVQILDTPTLSGPINLTAPHPVTNSEFTAALGRALRRPTLLPVPAGPLRLVLGRMARETLLASARVFPQRLQLSGFKHLHEQIDDALPALLVPRASRNRA